MIPKLSSPISYYNKIKKVCFNNSYDIAYCNLSFSNVLILIALRSAGLKKIVFHGHNTKIDSNSFWKRVLLTVHHYVSRSIFNLLLWKKVACSSLAFYWLFKEVATDTDIIHNAICISDFIYDKKLQQK